MKWTSKYHHFWFINCLASQEIMIILIRGIFVMIRILSIISLLLFSTSSFAEDYDEEIIFNEGAWEVAIWEYDESGISSCAAGL